jgi:hypothetical protein
MALYLIVDIIIGHSPYKRFHRHSPFIRDFNYLNRKYIVILYHLFMLPFLDTFCVLVIVGPILLAAPGLYHNPIHHSPAALAMHSCY